MCAAVYRSNKRWWKSCRMTLVMKKFTMRLSWKPKPNRKRRFFLQNLPKPTDRKHFETVTTLDEAVTDRGRLLYAPQHRKICRHRYMLQIRIRNTTQSLRNLCRILSCSICCVSEITSRHRSALIRALWADNAASGIISCHTCKLQTSQSGCRDTMQVHFVMCEVPATGSQYSGSVNTQTVNSFLQTVQCALACHLAEMCYQLSPTTGQCLDIRQQAVLIPEHFHTDTKLTVARGLTKKTFCPC